MGVTRSGAQRAGRSTTYWCGRLGSIPSIPTGSVTAVALRAREHQRALVAVPRPAGGRFPVADPRRPLVDVQFGDHVRLATIVPIVRCAWSTPAPPLHVITI